MAKKKARAAGQRAGKARLELRLDENVHERIKKLADDSELTVNQLVNGLVRWAGDRGRAGEPTRNNDGVLMTNGVPGVVWFGNSGYYHSEEDKTRHLEHFDEELCDFVKGEHFFTLDFTERRVIREDV